MNNTKNLSIGHDVRILVDDAVIGGGIIVAINRTIDHIKIEQVTIVRNKGVEIDRHTHTAGHFIGQNGKTVEFGE